MMKGFLTVLCAGALAMTTTGCFVGDDPEGQIRLTWSILVDNTPGTCAEVNATRIEVSARHDRSGDVFIDAFNCSAMAGTSDPMPTGPYTVTIRLLDAAGNTLNLVPVVTDANVLDGLVEDLGLFPFGFTFAKATFRVIMGNNANPTNCTSAGAGVAVQLVEVFSATGNQCLPFTITTNESTPFATCQNMVCHEKAVVHTIHGLGNGDYDVRITGYKGATGANPYPCYFSPEVPMDIRNGVNLDLGTIMAPFSSTVDARCDATKPGEG